MSSTHLYLGLERNALWIVALHAHAEPSKLIMPPASRDVLNPTTPQEHQYGPSMPTVERLVCGHD